MTSNKRRRSAAQSTVLYDALGPRGRRRVLIGTIVSALLALAFIAFFVDRLADSGQMEQRRWSYVLSNENLKYLWLGLVNNFKAAGIASAITLVAGLFLALGRLSPFRVIRVPTVAWIEFFRGFPVVLLIIFPALLIPYYYKDISPIWYIVLGLSLYNSAVMAEIYRAGILSLERGQSEAARSVGMSRGQTMRLIVLPQAVRRMTPLLLTQVIIVFKDSTLGEVVAYPEALRRGELLGSFQQLVVFQAIVVTAVLFFLASFILSRGVALIERRQRRRQMAPMRVPPGIAAIDVQQAGAV